MRIVTVHVISEENFRYKGLWRKNWEACRRVAKSLLLGVQRVLSVLGVVARSESTPEEYVLS